MRNAESFVIAFNQAYVRQDNEAAYEAFCCALKINADCYRTIVAPSGALAEIVQRLGKTAEVVRMLDNLFARYPHMHMICENKPEQMDYVLNLREQHLAKGMPSVVLATMEKSGSVSIGSIFTSGLSLPSFAYSLLNLEVVESWAKDYARGGCCYVTHLKPFIGNIKRLKRVGLDKMIVHTRDPRQAILSMIHHIERYSNAFPEYDNTEFRSLSLDEKLLKTLHFYDGYIQWIAGWLQASQKIEIMFSTFEEFARNRVQFTQRYLDFYGPAARNFNESAAFTEHEGIDYHRRLGEVDEWRRVFSASSQEILNKRLPQDIKDAFGWSKS